MNRNKRRTHQPQNAQCKTCRHKEADCTAIAFERMPTGSKTTHGITLVDCSCYQPTQQASAEAALRDNPLIVASATKPFTAQPEIQALALVMAATVDENGAEHGVVIGGGDFYTRFTRVMYELTSESPAFTTKCKANLAEHRGQPYLGLPGVTKCTTSDITDATVSVTRKASAQEPLNTRIAQLLDTFARYVYPNTPILLSKAEVMALARIRRHFNGFVTALFEQSDEFAAAKLWLEALGLTLPEHWVNSPLVKSQAHKAISEGLASPGADIKLPDSGTHPAMLAKLVNDILRQTNTKGYTFHSAEGAFLRIEG